MGKRGRGGEETLPLRARGNGEGGKEVETGRETLSDTVQHARVLVLLYHDLAE